MILYTDGVIEAFNPQQECYGEERLLADLATFGDRPAADIPTSLLKKVRAFAGVAPQSDDLAILAFKVGSSAR